MSRQDRPGPLFRHLKKACFIRRPNRFLVECRLGGRPVRAFLPNPGRLQELLLPGRTIYLTADPKTPHRRTRYTAVAVLREGHPILLHTHKTNEAARFLIEEGRIPGLKGARILRSEVRMGHSRFDFLLKRGRQDILLEVKSCTLVGEKVAMFPDAVTERGARHLKELAALAERGAETILLFLVHWPFAKLFLPDYHTDLEFSKVLLEVRRKVKVIPLSIGWRRDLSLSPEVHRLRIPWSLIEQEAQDRGSYLLLLKLRRDRKLSVGSLGRLPFKKGFYLYVGSAMSQLSRRIERHRRLRKRHRWHIDFLREKAHFCSALPIRSSARLECEIAQALGKVSEWTVERFGCSDCSCRSHLFGMSEDPLRSEAFQKVLQHFRMDRLFARSRGA
ncbi:MAG: DNA/RNA nuclease SfsA [Desulfobacterota bacterium]|nr:DNA/RNA nuclease SfsA [Thermodesulfobacteriota bacterium]